MGIGKYREKKKVEKTLKKKVKKKKLEYEQKRQSKTPLSLSRQSWRVRAENGFTVK